MLLKVSAVKGQIFKTSIPSQTDIFIKYNKN